MSDSEEYYIPDDEDDGGYVMTPTGTQDAAFGAATAQAKAAAAAAKPIVLTPDEVVERINTDVGNVAGVLAWSRASALLLLRHFKWNVDVVTERYYEDPEGVSKVAKVENFEQDDLTICNEETTCNLCWDDVPGGESASLSCKHLFCLPCWTTHLTWELKNSGTNSIAARCPQAKCMHICGQESFDMILQKAGATDALKKYREVLIRAFVTENERFCQCQSPSCENLIQYPTPRHLIETPCASVKCTCNYQFCFKCLEEEHSPTTCAQLKEWKKKEQDESETANWVAANTKQCPAPKCGKSIEKNGGCNHMSCPACKYEWCWVCEGEWAKHGSSWYKCNYFDASKHEGSKDDARAKAKTELQRYLHYYTRFRNHEQSKKLDKKVLQRTRDRIARELSKTQVSLVEVDYLEKTASVLIACRHTLMYTYIYSYFLKEGREKELFEYQQNQLEYATERMSEFIEDTKQKYGKQEIVNRTSTAETMLQQLQEGCLKTTK